MRSKLCTSCEFEVVRTKCGVSAVCSENETLLFSLSMGLDQQLEVGLAGTISRLETLRRTALVRHSAAIRPLPTSAKGDGSGVAVGEIGSSVPDWIGLVSSIVVEKRLSTHPMGTVLPTGMIGQFLPVG